VRAWRNGPVVRSAYSRLRRYQDRPIGREAIRTNPDAVLAEPVKRFLDKIIATYGHYSPGDLVGFTHMRGSAWRMVRDDNGFKKGDDSDIAIPDDLLASTLSSQFDHDLDLAAVTFDQDGSLAAEFDSMRARAV
ncbi:MAG: DUF4065 domain-containing protein, partial [Alphaproteobacteria bacterium]|nr:DUF4065 domain-containing protein [Alphaproteobacteria bacterium]